jgi:hypothetical protein
VTVVATPTDEVGPVNPTARQAVVLGQATA